MCTLLLINMYSQTLLYILPHILYIVILNSCYIPYSPELEKFHVGHVNARALRLEKGGQGGGGGVV